MRNSLAELLKGPAPVRAPLVLDPLMARLAQRAGFEAVYFGGGGLGYAKTYLEANLNLTEMVQAGIDIAASSSLPMILDGACGWGDAMHMVRTIRLVQAAGFAAIELEDSPFPKRAGHHAGEDETIPSAAMEAKLRAAAEARGDGEPLIIARTNVAGADPEDALRRSLAYRAAGADVLLPVTGAVRDPDVIVRLGRELGPPLMFLAPPGGLAHVELTPVDLHDAGYRILVDAMSLHLRVYASLADGYAQLAEDGFSIDRERTAADWWQLLGELHETVELDSLLAIERQTADSA
jgi:methylisocitrate lyase